MKILGKIADILVGVFFSLPGHLVELAFDVCGESIFELAETLVDVDADVGDLVVDELLVKFLYN